MVTSELSHHEEVSSELARALITEVLGRASCSNPPQDPEVILAQSLDAVDAPSEAKESLDGVVQAVAGAVRNPRDFFARRIGALFESARGRVVPLDASCDVITGQPVSRETMLLLTTEGAVRSSRGVLRLTVWRPANSQEIMRAAIRTHLRGAAPSGYVMGVDMLGDTGACRERILRGRDDRLVPPREVLSPKLATLADLCIGFHNYSPGDDPAAKSLAGRPVLTVEPTSTPPVIIAPDVTAGDGAGYRSGFAGA